MPTLEHNSLLAWIGRRRPELFNSRGNAFSSLFRAWLVTEEPGQPSVKAEHDQSDVVSTFLFIQDAPIVTQVRSYYTGATGTFVLPEIDFDEWQLLPTGESAMAADILAADKPVFDACEVMTGATVTNGVEVQGYYVGINIRNRGIEQEEEPATCKLNMSLWSKGAVMEGPTWYTYGMTPTPHIYEPIILQETAYTQAMRDAGNTITLVGPGVILVYMVVGLWATFTAPE